jgi:hypothetical protein
MTLTHELSKIMIESEYDSYSISLIFKNVNISPTGVSISDINNWITQKKEDIYKLDFSNTAITNKEAIEICEFILSSSELFKYLKRLDFNNTNVVFNGFESDIGKILHKLIRTINKNYFMEEEFKV